MTQMVKNLPAMQETKVQSLGQEDPWRSEWLPTPVFLPGVSVLVHGRNKCWFWGRLNVCVCVCWGGEGMWELPVLSV